MSDDVHPVERLVVELHGFERQLRTLFAAGGRLSTSLADAHVAQPIAVGTGHQAYAGVSAAQAQIGQAIASIAGAHRSLDQLAKALGIDVTSYGDPHPKPSATEFFTRASSEPAPVA